MNPFLSSALLLLGVSLPVGAVEMTTAEQIAQNVGAPTLAAGAQCNERIASSVHPRYPKDAARQGITGWVVLAYTLRKDGSIEDLRVEDHRPAAVFDEASLEAVGKWSFSPGDALRECQALITFWLPK